MTNSLQIYAAITGSKFSRKPNSHAPQGIPGIPYTSAECIDDVIACYQLGAQLIHIHSRSNTGQHTMIPLWYYKFSNIVRKHCPNITLCFATSRAGQVAKQIRHRHRNLIGEGFTYQEASLQAEFERVGYLKTDDSSLWPDYITAFTATEVKLICNELETGHVNDVLSSDETSHFFKHLLAYTNQKKIKHEIEITTPESINIFNLTEYKALWSEKPSIVILPGFTRSFHFSPETLDVIISKSRRWLNSIGGGHITLGRVVSSNEDSILARYEHVKYALNNPDIDAIRVGIEDGPFFGKRILSNSQLILKTTQIISELGGNISAL